LTDITLSRNDNEGATLVDHPPYVISDSGGVPINQVVYARRKSIKRDAVEGVQIMRVGISGGFKT
jgi:hypothetical protein